MIMALALLADAESGTTTDPSHRSQSRAPWRRDERPQAPLAQAPLAQAPLAQPSVPTPAPPIDFTQGAGLMIKQVFDAFDRDADGVLSQSEYDVFCTVTEGVGCDPDRWIRHCVSLKIPSEVGIPLRQFARLYLDDELRRHQGRQQHVRRFHPLPLLPTGLSHGPTPLPLPLSLGTRERTRNSLLRR